jgi:four helix bundle protein
MGTFQKLVAWQEAQALAAEVYRVSAQFPTAERFGLTSQLRRAAVSVPSNLAEGVGRGSGPALRAFARISRGSLQELCSQLLLAQTLGYLDGEKTEAVLARAARVGRLLSGLSR